MQLREDRPAILATWLDFVTAYERLVEETGDGVVPPSLELVSSFAGALVASLADGVADPFANGVHVLLPDGTRALVAVAPEGRGADFGLTLDPYACPADWVALVAFRNYRPVAIHVIDARQLPALQKALGVAAPLPPQAPPTAMVLSTLFHWNLCLEPLIAEVFGVRTYWLTDEGASCVPDVAHLPVSSGSVFREVV